MSKIPARARMLAKNRYAGRCANCGMAGSDPHHRRGRSVIDDHTHCPCNLVWLCRNCHDWAHANPLQAEWLGFIVSRYEPDPFAVHIKTPWGVRYHDCRGVSL